MTRFELVAFGASAPPRAASCDGLVEGAELDLSHWPDNDTPARYKADSSTEIALRFAADPDRELELCVNNHFDVDGALTALSLMQPALGLAHREVFVAAAEAGDFDEWPKNERGIWLCAAIASLTAGLSEAASYEAVFERLPAIVPHLSAREDLWGERFHGLQAALAAVARGEVSVERVGPIAIIAHPRGASELDGLVASRSLPAGVSRVLWAFERDKATYDYRYEMPRYAWADTVTRPALERPSKNALVVALGGSWSLKGDALGMTGLIRTQAPLAMRPLALADSLLERERELGTL